MNSRIPVCYSNRQSVPKVSSFSPSAGKPTIIAQALQDEKFPVQFFAPRGMLFWELARVHDPTYVKGVLQAKAENGLGTRNPRVAASLPYTCGSMLGAALAASPDLPACSLTSGFHHACWNHGGGFCTFNGLATTAAALLTKGTTSRVAILDCDAHYGNGTDDILRRFPALAGKICHLSVGSQVPITGNTSTW